MANQRIRELECENWARLSSEARLEALNQFERQLAEQQQRQPCTIRCFTNEEIETEYQGDRIGLRGDYNSETNLIRINPALVNEEQQTLLNGNLVNCHEPYLAVETVLHETTHAQQHHIVNQPELLKNQPDGEMLAKNNGAGYIPPGNGLYYAQPVEIQARENARKAMDELYSKDGSSYDQYRAQRVSEDQTRMESLNFFFGDAQEAARKEVDHRYEQSFKQNQSTDEGLASDEVKPTLETHSAGEAPSVVNTESSTDAENKDEQRETTTQVESGIAAESKTPQVPDLSIDEDYGYGYGM